MPLSLPSALITRRSRTLLAALAVALLTAATLTLHATPARAASRTLTVSFASGIGASSLGGGLASSVRLAVLTTDGGALTRTTAADGSRSAVRTPAFNATTHEPHAVITVSDSTPVDVLDPGTADVQIQAEVSVDALSSENGTDDNGDNVIQRGRFAAPQYKLQIDRHVPSCRMTGSAGSARVLAPAAVVPGDWYRLTCTRSGSVVSLVVQHYVGGTWQTISTTSTKRATGSIDIAPDVPLSIGGKLAGNGSIATNGADQLNGRYANLLVRIG